MRIRIRPLFRTATRLMTMIRSRFRSTSRSAGNAHCPGCGTTWDKIRHDGRAGCAACYLEFREQLSGVMARVQRGELHTGKTPRSIEKRQHRLQHLRKRRDNQLAVLQARLQNAVASEKYEEAARLRDKIKLVTSTIVG